MSEERELLRKILKANDEGYVSFVWFASLKNEIQELLAQPEQPNEPVAWRWKKTSGWSYQDNNNNGGEPLYTSPTRKPLSVDRLAQLYALNILYDPIIFARQVEKAHGIGVDDD